MIFTTHALTGAAIGKSIDNPFIIVALSIMLHFIMDGFRHGEYLDSSSPKTTFRNSVWKVVLDIFIAGSIIISAILSNQDDLKKAGNILLGAFFSTLPDLCTVLYWRFGGKFWGAIKKFHELAHRYDRWPRLSKERQWTLRNALNDILISSAAIIVLFL